jgi:major membrane immunogen (membrane-anchored lipoprotein)
MSLLGISLMVAGSSLALASSAPNYYGGAGGTISGIVVSPSGNLVDWSQIHASNGNQTFEAFSGFSGFYLMRVPAGTYNVSVYDFYDPAYWAPSVNVTVTDGSNTTVNFYLQRQPPVAVPEFQPNLLAVVTMLAIAAACVLAKGSRKLLVSH